MLYFLHIGRRRTLTRCGRAYRETCLFKFEVDVAYVMCTVASGQDKSIVLSMMQERERQRLEERATQDIRQNHA